MNGANRTACVDDNGLPYVHSGGTKTRQFSRKLIHKLTH
jgi:hypothetical protein